MQTRANWAHPLQQPTGVKTRFKHTAHNYLIGQLLDNAVKWSDIQLLTHHLQILNYINSKGRLMLILEDDYESSQSVT